MKRAARTEIPRQAIYRLSVYLRCLQRLKGNQVQTVSSEALAKAAGVKPTQLRKDLTYFGQFGTRGLGYDVEQLAQRIAVVLGTRKLQPVVLVGVGNLGAALLAYRGFEKEGFEVITANGGREGLERAKTDAPDVVITPAPNLLGKPWATMAGRMIEPMATTVMSGSCPTAL